MAFTVEDGTGVVDANSYIAEAEFRSYHADRGVDVTTLTQAQVEQSCVRATDYIDKRFGRRFRGWRESKSQGLEWPRIDAIDNDGYLLDLLPKQLRHATAEYALRAHYLGQLAPDPALQVPTRDTTGSGTTESAGQVRSKTEKVGPIEESTQYADTASSGTRTTSASVLLDGTVIPAYPAADLLLEELLTSTLSRDLTRA